MLDSPSTPPSSASNSINFLATTLPTQNCRNISGALNDYQNLLFSEELISDRPSDIMATLWAVLSLKILDPASLSLKKQAIVQFILSKYNETSQHFEADVIYPTTNWIGENIVLNPYQAHIIHQVAIIILAELGVLSTYFTSLIINNWKAEIWEMKQPDKGFGDSFADNSTITETYFAVYALLALNDFSGLTFSAAAKQDVRDYLLSRINPVDHWFMPNAIREYHTDPVFGFVNYHVVWFFAKIVSMLALNPGLFNVQIKNFLIENDHYNQNLHCFYRHYNDKGWPNNIFYGGTAIWGEILRIMNIEGFFPDLSNAIGVLKNGLRWNIKNIDYGPNYFQSSNRSDEHRIISVFIQYLSILYLHNKGELPALESQNPAQFAAFKSTMNRYFTIGGGASYYHPDVPYPLDIFTRYSAADAIDAVSAQFTEAELYAKIMTTYGNDSYTTSPGFIDYALTNSPASIIRPMYSIVNTQFRDHYFGTKFLTDFQLLDNFYLDVGASKYLSAEGNFANKLTPSGYFADSANNLHSPSHLQNTFYVLAAQKSFIDFDTGQTFGAYYSPEQIDSIINFVSQYIVETDNLWYAAADSPRITEIEATYYCYSVLKIFTSVLAIEPIISAYIQSKLNSAESISVNDLGMLAALSAELGLYFPYTPSKHSHTQIENTITNQISKNMLNATFSRALASLARTDSLAAFIQYQTIEIAGNQYTLKITAGNWLNMQSLSEIRFAGLELTQDPTGIAQMDYICPFDPTNPSLFSPLIEFMHKGIKFEFQMVIIVSYSYILSSFIDVTEDKCTIRIKIQSHAVIYQTLIPVSFYLYYEDLLMYTVEPSQISYQTLPEGLNASCVIPKSVFQKSPALTEYTIYCNFSHTFIESLQLPLDLDGSPIIEVPENTTEIPPSQKYPSPQSSIFTEVVKKSIFAVISVSFSGGVVIFAFLKKKSISNESPPKN
jgi:hypothetical protein